MSNSAVDPNKRRGALRPLPSGRLPPLRAVRLLDRLRERIRYLHYSRSTEDIYLYWFRSLIRFHGLRHPREMGGYEVETWLAYEQQLTSATHKLSMWQTISVTTGACLLAALAGCVTHETYGDPLRPDSELAVVEGYWHYRFLYDEQLHIASVDGKREGGRSGWPYAYSISLPSGRHWLQLAVLRNSQAVARCALEWTFEGGHRYKLRGLDHDQFLLAHPSSSPFRASVSMVVTAPADSDQHVSVSAVCGKEAMCLQDSDCARPDSCQMIPGFAFGICSPR